MSKSPGPLERVLKNVVTRFAQRISLDVSPDTFTFANANATATVTLGTYVYVDDTAADLRVLAVGEIVPDSTGLVRVDLFRDNSDASTSRRRIESIDCLEALVRYGI